MNKYKLTVCVFACATLQKYKEQILKIEETWGKRSIQKGVKVLYFLGEEKTDLIDVDKYIYLKNVGNNVESASHKQNLGLKFICENYNTEFVFCCGSDTFLNVDKALKYLDTLNSSKNLYIGGDGDYRKVGNDNIYYHSGGGGFFLSNSLLQILYPKLQNLQAEWEDICNSNYVHYLKVACDVLIGYYVKDIKDIEIIKKNKCFKGCNHKGYANNNTFKCCNIVNINELISCHYMTLSDFDEFYSILEENNYFTDL